MSSKIYFKPKTEDDPDFDPMSNMDNQIQAYRDWLETHGDYGRLFMWIIGKSAPKSQSSVIGVTIYDDEIATLFRLMFCDLDI